MTDLCKAVKAHLDEIDHLVSGADYVTHRLVQERLGDVMELLKEQEAVKPIERNGFYYCGACRYALMTNHQKYCSDCGKKVKWGDR